MKTKDEWLDDMEQRLKRALLDVAELNEGEGIRYLEQEIASHLDDVSGDRARFDYILSLRERFPKLLPDEANTSESLQASDCAIGEITPEEAMKVVRENWEQIGSDLRNSFLNDLSGDDPVNLVVADSASHDSASDNTESHDPVEVLPGKRSRDREEGGFLGEPTDEFVRFLKLSEDVSLSNERMQTALIGLLKTVSQVDSLGTQVYKQVGMSRDLNSEDIRKLVGSYLSGSGVEVDRLNQVFDETRLKVGLIISSIASIPSSLSNTHMAKFQPSLIEQSVGGGGGLLSGKEAKCWKKYVALSEDIQPQKLEKAINDLIIKQLKKLKRR